MREGGGYFFFFFFFFNEGLRGRAAAAAAAAVYSWVRWGTAARFRASLRGEDGGEMRCRELRKREGLAARGFVRDECGKTVGCKACLWSVVGIVY